MVPRMTVTAMPMRRVLGETFMMTFFNDTRLHDHGQPAGASGDVIWRTRAGNKPPRQAKIARRRPRQGTRRQGRADQGTTGVEGLREQRTALSRGRKPLGMSGKAGLGRRKPKAGGGNPSA